MKSIIEEILNHAEEMPDKAAIITEKGRVSYGQLGAEVSTCLGYMLNHGVHKGDRVLIEAIPEPDFVAAYLAIHRIGAMAIPVQKNGEANLLNEIISETKPMLFIGTNLKDDEDCYNYCTYSQIKQENHSCKVTEYPDMDDVADVLFTSGTTSKPKGVMLTHQNIRAGAENIMEGVEMVPEDVELLGLPLFHAQALGSLRALLLCGATAVLLDGYTSWNKIYHLLKEKRCTAIGLVPSVLQILNELTKGRMDLMLGSVRYIEIGAAPLSLDMRRRLMQQLPNTALCVNYGTTESPRTIYHNLNKFPDKIEAIGRPMSKVRAEIMDEHNTIMKSSKDQIGILAFYGSMNMKGYWNNSEMTEDAINNGWYYTTDTAYKDEDNFIYLTGRSKDILNIGGIKVSVSEIENLLSMHEAVQETACIGIEDPEGVMGEVPVAYIVVREGKEVTSDELHAYLEDKIKPYKIPRQWIFLKELPKNFMGKINKIELRERLSTYEK